MVSPGGYEGLAACLLHGLIAARRIPFGSENPTVPRGAVLGVLGGPRVSFSHVKAGIWTAAKLATNSQVVSPPRLAFATRLLPCARKTPNPFYG